MKFSFNQKFSCRKSAFLTRTECVFNRPCCSGWRRIKLQYQRPLPVSLTPLSPNPLILFTHPNCGFAGVWTYSTKRDPLVFTSLMLILIYFKCAVNTIEIKTKQCLHEDVFAVYTKVTFPAV